MFIILREKHVITWSWWWLVAMQAMSVVGMFMARDKIKDLID